jgi:hypothetical protein
MITQFKDPNRKYHAINKFSSFRQIAYRSEIGYLLPQVVKLDNSIFANKKGLKIEVEEEPQLQSDCEVLHAGDE